MELLLMPYDILAVIFEFLALNSQLDFLTTCKQYRKLFFCDEVIQITTITYKAFINVNDGYLLKCITNDSIFTRIKKLTLVLMTDVVSNINFPNLIELELISNHYIFLQNWDLPLLKILDITNCIGCVLDECNLILLNKLYINYIHILPFRFCIIPKDSQIIRIFPLLPDTIIIRKLVKTEEIKEFSNIKDTLLLYERIKCFKFRTDKTNIKIKKYIMCNTCYELDFSYDSVFNDMNVFSFCHCCACDLIIRMNINDNDTIFFSNADHIRL